MLKEQRNFGFWALILFTLTSGIYGEPARIVATGDSEGRVSPLTDGTNASAGNGLASRASLFSELRKKSPLLLVDAGNAFFGPESHSTKGGIIVHAYNSMNYDAVNIGFRDFRMGKEVTRDILKSASFTPLSANIYDKGTGKRLFAPFVILDRGEKRFIVIGLTERPPGADSLPHLKSQYRGIEIVSAKSELQSLLPEVLKEDGQLILLYYGSQRSLESLKAGVKLPPNTLYFVAGDTSTLSQFDDKSTVHLSTDSNLAGLMLSGDSSSLEKERITIPTDLPQDPKFLIQLEELTRKTTTEDKVRSSLVPVEMPEGGKTLRIYGNDAHQGMAITVYEWRTEDLWQGKEAPKDKQYLILEVGIENQMDFRLIERLEYESAIQVAGLQNKAYLVINQRRIIRHPKSATFFKGHLPNQFVLSTLGQVAEGQIIFEIPNEGIESLDFVLYHDEFPSLSIKILGEASAATETVELITQSQNEVLELGLYHVEKVPSPLEGHQRLILDLRGRSKMSRKADSAALDPRVAVSENQPIDHAIPLDYQYFSDLVALVLPDERGIAPTDIDSEFPTLPSFLPDRMAGGKLVFDIPEAYAGHALKLKAWFPTLRLAGDGGGTSVNPAPIELTIQAGTTTKNPPPPLIIFPDGDLTLEVLTVEANKVLFKQSAPEEKKWVKVQARLMNAGDQPGFMPMQKRFGFTHDNKRIVSETSEVVRSPFHPRERFYLPAKDSRVFELLFQVPEDWESAYFDYRGVKSNLGQFIDFGNGSVINDNEVPAPQLINEDIDEPADTFAINPGIPSAPLPQIDAPETIETVSWATPEKEDKNDIVIIPPGEGISVDRSDSLSSVQVKAHRYYLLDSYYGETPARGMVLLAVDVELSRLPLEEGTVSIPYLDRVLLIRINGSNLLNMVRFHNTDPQISNEITLTSENPSVRNFVFYSIPIDSLGSVDLLYTQDIGPPAFIPLIVNEGIASPEPIERQQNQVAELGLFGFDYQETFLGRRSRNGGWLVVDIRGTSKLRDAALKSDPENKETHLLHWRDWKPRIQLILDGKKALLVNQVDFDKESRILPGVLTGARIAFDLSPEQFAELDSIQLQCGFAPTAIPNGSVASPDTLYFTLKGDPNFKSPRREALLSLPDLNLNLDIIEVNRPEFVREKPAAGNSEWVKVDIGITSTSKQGTFFKPGDLLELIDRDRLLIKPFNETWHGPNAPPHRGSKTWIPKGGRREFSMFWQVKTKQKPVRLRVNGIRQFRSLNLFPEEHADENVLTNPDINLSISESGVMVLPPQAVSKGIEGVGITPEQINHAIDTGRDYLWSEFKEDIRKRGKISPRGPNYLAVLALVHCKAHLTYPEFDRALRQFISEADVKKNGSYINSILAMTIEAYGDPVFIPKMQEVAHYFVETQGEEGTWGYTAPSPEHFYTEPTLKEKSKGPPPVLEIIGGEAPPDITLPEGPIERTQTWEKGNDGDHSVTQFAVLALWSAERSGVPISDDVWKRVLSRMSQRQNIDTNQSYFGGYAYKSKGSAYGSMTAAGICILAISMDRLLDDVTPREHLRIRNGLSWLVQNFKVEENPLKKQYNYYYIYSLERVGQILGIDFIGDYEWYPLGASSLIKSQTGAGSWPVGPGENDSKLTTSFALLFLTRATPSLESGPHIEPKGPGTLETFVRVPDIQHQVYLILDSSGSMRPEINGVSKLDIARSAITDLAASLPKETQIAVRAYGHQKRSIEPGSELDTELVIPWTDTDPEQIKVGLSRLRAKGKTPLALSLKEALGDIPTNQKGQTILILLTDGGEDDRATDPVAEAAAFAGREDIEFFILGFDINRPAWTQQLSEMAEAGKGVYLPVQHADRLTSDLQSIIVPPIPEFKITDSEGKDVSTSVFGSAPLSLPKGDYTLEALGQEVDFKTSFYVRAEGTTKITLDMTQLPKRSLSTPAVRAEDNAPSREQTAPKPTTISFCTTCGSKLTAGSRFCTGCGTSVK